MCGIVGCLSIHPMDVRTAALRHRGPDACGTVQVDLGWATVALGSTRLAIVDCRDIAVPFAVGYDPAVVALNGEIYNWRDLRAELSDGTPWATRSDVEVVLRAWRAWGPAMLDRFDGMFALAVADPATHRLLLARDRAGEKPLFYHMDNGDLHFASEIKALPGPFREAPCPEVDVFEYDCLDTTPFLGVHRLPPGARAVLDGPRDAVPVQTWWKLPEEVDEGMSWPAAVEQTQALVESAVRLRVPDEVPGTVLVSGGLDSALVQAVARAPRVYCCTFPADGIDCLPLATLAARGAEVVPVTFGLAEAQEALPQIAWHLDTPATWSAVAEWFLAARMRQDGYKVVLSGEGADELFGGYARYRILDRLDAMRADPNLRRYGPLCDHMIGTADEVLVRMLDRSPQGQARDHARTLVARYGGPGSLAERMMRVEWHTTMQVLLRMADRMAAASSMENRSPFLDHRLIELTARMPVQHKITQGESKAVLREVARRLGVPGPVVDDRDKRGLVVPWNAWTQAAGGSRGAWDRRGFADAMTAAWRGAWHLPTPGC